MVNYVYLVATVSTFMWVSTFTLPTNEAIEDGSVRLGNCRSNNDCRPSGCCVIGLMRFSSPWCQPLLQLGDTCRPASSKPILNTTLSYPNGLHVTLKDAHQVLCPCDARQGLFCNPMSGICTVGVLTDEQTKNDV